MNLTDIVQHFEGLYLKSYLDPDGHPTIGWGSKGPDIKLGMTWTREQCEARLERDCNISAHIALNLCPQLNTEGRFLAVSDFTYNLGAARLAGSTLRRKIKKLDWTGAANQFPRWVRGGARVLPGLVTRRAFEQSLFLRS